MRRFTAFLIAILAFVGPVRGADTLESLADGGGGRVAAVIDGDTVRLADADADIRLIGLQAPKLPLGRKGFAAWPLADEARAALAALALDRDVRVRLGATPRDRNSRTLAHLVRSDGLWIQGEMLRLGWARVYTFADNRALADAMASKEREARATGRGIWSHPYYAIRRADDPKLLNDVDTFQIVTGRVRATACVRALVFLNFGDDFRSDFTVSIERPAWPAFDAAGIDPLAFEGDEIEVRGWVGRRGGPAIEIDHPEQIAKLAGAQP
jgi:endonuclease YncB( thermonuclease family)